MDPLESIIRALSTKPQMCLHELAMHTNLSAMTLRTNLLHLVKEKKVKNVSAGLFKHDKVYALVDQTMVEQAVQAQRQFLFGVDEGTALSRVHMLNRMKQRLICEWHPCLDLLISDYDKGLKFAQSLRGENADDALDDFSTSEDGS